MKQDTKTLYNLGEEIDQLSSEARGFTDFPHVARSLDLAWMGDRRHRQDSRQALAPAATRCNGRI